MTNITRFILPGLAVLLVLGGIVALAWAGSREQNGVASQQDPAPVPPERATPQPSHPTYDVAAPSQVETATFALG